MSERLTASDVLQALLAIASNPDRDFSFQKGIGHAYELVRSNLIESPDERRERFEKWHMDRFGDDEAAIELIEKDEAGGYESGVANAMWLAFNAALDFRGDK